jgi:hypothetical protein
LLCQEGGGVAVLENEIVGQRVQEKRSGVFENRLPIHPSRAVEDEDGVHGLEELASERQDEQDGFGGQRLIAQGRQTRIQRHRIHGLGRLDLQGVTGSPIKNKELALREEYWPGSELFSIPEQDVAEKPRGLAGGCGLSRHASGSSAGRSMARKERLP